MSMLSPSMFGMVIALYVADGEVAPLAFYGGRYVSIERG